MLPAHYSLIRWIYLLMQVREAAHYIQRAEELIHPPDIASLENLFDTFAPFRGALISYSKCFARAGHGRVTLDKNSVFKGDAKRLMWHDRIMELRHKYIAHSDMNEFESAHLVEESNAEELVLRLQYKFSFPFDRLYELRELI